MQKFTIMVILAGPAGPRGAYAHVDATDLEIALVGVQDHYEREDPDSVTTIFCAFEGHIIELLHYGVPAELEIQESDED